MKSDHILEKTLDAKSNISGGSLNMLKSFFKPQASKQSNLTESNYSFEQTQNWLLNPGGRQL
jgi:hypothetical protein